MNPCTRLERARRIATDLLALVQQGRADCDHDCCQLVYGAVLDGSIEVRRLSRWCEHVVCGELEMAAEDGPPREEGEALRRPPPCAGMRRRRPGGPPESEASAGREEAS